MGKPTREAIEARKELCDWIFDKIGHRFGHPKSVAQIDAFFQSAIEKAREQWLIEGKAEVAAGAAQPQRSPDEVIEIDEHGRVYPEGALDWMKPQPQRSEPLVDLSPQWVLDREAEEQPASDAASSDNLSSKNGIPSIRQTSSDDSSVTDAANRRTATTHASGAASSEPPQWTITKDSHFAYLKSSAHGSFMFPVSEFDQLQQVTVCINAALAAERETKNNYKREAMELARLLDAEREKREALQGFAEKARLYERQLLAAQAAIAEIRDHVKGYGERPPSLFRVEEMCNKYEQSKRRN